MPESGRSRLMDEEDGVNVVSHLWRGIGDLYLSWRCERCRWVTVDRDEAPACGGAA